MGVRRKPAPFLLHLGNPMKDRIVYSLLLVYICGACTPSEKAPLFTKLDNSDTGIAFRNLLKEENPEFNILAYPYFYNGGGVAVGDVNNDGLDDLFFTGNMVRNKLYINRGALRFEDITETSRVAKKEGWCTGVTMADVNGDGWQDIYICRSGLPNVAYRRNLLFINNHDLTFSEQAAAYGLDDAGYSTQASFFDYDRDGDLDMMLINQSKPEYARGNMDYLQQRRQPVDSTFSNKLFRNDGGHFRDVTTRAGISSTVFTFSLGLSTADINQDGWPDIYVANDFKEGDYYYINNGDGTFTNRLEDTFDHTALYSMGMDVADYNNDLLPDIIVADMLSEGNYAQKMHMGGDNYTQYKHLFDNGMPYQYMRNMLQRNNGDGTFSEIGRLAGVAATDWSWSPLLADLDNDGRRDLFISNGYMRDNTDMQFVVYSMNRSLQGPVAVAVPEYISHMPGISIPNYIFRNVGEDRFKDVSAEWGIGDAGFSQGAVYTDLDNDGDLDLVTNNTGDYASVYRNNGEAVMSGHYLAISLSGTRGNFTGIGAKVYAYANGDRYYAEQLPVRGYQSSIGHTLHLGLGKHAVLDSLKVIWPDGSTTRRRNVLTNTKIVLQQVESVKESVDDPVAITPWLLSGRTPEYRHSEPDRNDFTQQFLLPHYMSHGGPCLASGDVNGDGLADVYAGGGRGQGGMLLMQKGDGSFHDLRQSSFRADSAAEDSDAAFFDADGDGDLDLYVVSSGYTLAEGDAKFEDRLYKNDGKGHFTRSELPTNLTNKRCVRPFDIDNDGDVDLFVGGGVKPGAYPLACRSALYRNDGHGRFQDITVQWLDNVDSLGFVNTVVATDLNGDRRMDLVLAGEWMSLRALVNTGTVFEDASGLYFPHSTEGWWTALAAADMDNDGDTDLVAGNYGLNTLLKANEQEPVRLFYPDLDDNGSLDPILTAYTLGVSYPVALRDDLIGQVPSLKKKFNDYGSYARASIADILPASTLKTAPRLKATTFASIYLERTGSGFIAHTLPVEAQYAPVYAIAVADFDKDGHLDIVLAGNQTHSRIYLGRYDAGHGTVLHGDGHGGFAAVSPAVSGITLKGDIRSAVLADNSVLFGANNSALKVYRFAK